MNSNNPLYRIKLAVQKVFRDARRNRQHGWIKVDEIQENATQYLFQKDVKRLHKINYRNRIRGIISDLYNRDKYIERLERATYKLNIKNPKVEEWFNKLDSYTDYYSIDGITYGEER